jgi:hypothetical protein
MDLDCRTRLCGKQLTSTSLRFGVYDSEVAQSGAQYHSAMTAAKQSTTRLEPLLRIRFFVLALNFAISNPAEKPEGGGCLSSFFADISSGQESFGIYRIGLFGVFWNYNQVARS